MVTIEYFSWSLVFVSMVSRLLYTTANNTLQTYFNFIALKKLLAILSYTAMLHEKNKRSLVIKSTFITGVWS